MRNGWQALALVAGLVFAIGCGGQDKGEEAVPGDVISYPDLGPQKTGSNHPPKLHKVGNKEVQVGQELSVLLAADDEDGDSLTFSMYGDMPPGAKFFKPEGRFTWKPDDVAGPYFLTFVVSDKKDFDSETVELRAVLSSTQHPPRFETVGDQFLKIGELF